MINSTSPRALAIETAVKILSQEPVFLDTETTGLGRTDEIVEIAVVDHLGNVLVDQLVKPSRPIPAEVIKIHGITDEMVQKAPVWPILWTQIRHLLVGKIIIAYNAEFDKKMMIQSHERYRVPWKDSLQFIDLRSLYSQFRGEWDGQRGSYKYFSLDAAGKLSGILLPNAHRSLADTLLARELLLYIAGMAV